jgi:hypothetical protein
VHVKVLGSRIPISDAKLTVIQTKNIHQLRHRPIPGDPTDEEFIEQTFP